MHSRILILLSLAASGLAQDTAPLKLTLKDAVNLALKQNPQVILANLNVGQSEQDIRVARSALLPQVGGNVSETVHRINLQLLDDRRGLRHRVFEFHNLFSRIHNFDATQWL